MAQKTMTPPVSGARGARTLMALKICITGQALAIFAQAVFAGLMLNGNDDMRDVHGTGAMAVLLFGLLQLIMAVLYWRPGRGPGWPALVSLALLLAGFAQSATGGSGALSVHIPLAMALFGAVTWMLVWAWAGRRPTG